MRFTIPIRLPSLANARMHWRRLAALKARQRAATRLVMRAALNAGAALPAMPVVVTITRAGPRRLDDDNLAAACKYVRDAVAAALGTDDGSPLYAWRYRQRVGKYEVEVEIASGLGRDALTGGNSCGNGL